MATLEKLYGRTKTLVDDSIENAVLNDWFNQCMEDLSNILYLPTRPTLVKDTTGFAVPENYNGELKFITEISATEYHVYDGYIHFEGEEDLEELEVQYNRFPLEIAEVTTTIPDIPPRFHSIFVFHSCMQYCHVEEEFDRFARYEKEYNKMYNALNKYMSKVRPKPDRWEVER